MTKIHQNVSRLINQIGVTQSSLAAVSGVSRRTIGRMINAAQISGEAQTYTPSDDTVQKLATTLGVPAKKLHKRMTRAELTQNLEIQEI